MEDTLSPGVRRMPLDQWRVTPPAPTGSIKPAATEPLMAQSTAPAQPEAVPASGPQVSDQAAVAQVESESASLPSRAVTLPTDVRPAAINPATNKPISANAMMKRA